MPALVEMSAAAQTRLRHPRTRGAFAPVDAARRQLGLLSVADAAGQARLYWLVDLGTQIIEDARFIAFGDLASHPIMDAFTELVRGRTVADAGRLTAEQIESLLRDQGGEPAFASLDPLAFVRDLQDRAEAELPRVTLLPRPVDAPIYVRKRKADWSPADERWLPLTLFKKAAAVEAILAHELSDRLAGAEARLDAINDDFQIKLRFTGAAEAQFGTLCQIAQDALRSALHPQLTVSA